MREQATQLQSSMTFFKVDEARLSLASAEVAHMTWKTRIRAFLDGRSALGTAEAVSHRECAFGKWYYAGGREKFNDIAEMQQIDAPHAELHQVIKEIVRLKQAGNLGGAERLYERVEALSDRMVGLLDQSERKAGGMDGPE